MIKRVNSSDVRLGMYIHELRGNWLEHPFWKKSFKLDDPKDLDKLIHSAIEEIWIDTEKGLDVADVTAPQPPTPDPEPLNATPSIIKKTVSFDEELSVAKKNTHKSEKCRHIDVQCAYGQSIRCCRSGTIGG